MSAQRPKSSTLLPYLVGIGAEVWKAASPEKWAFSIPSIPSIPVFIARVQPRVRAHARTITRTRACVQVVLGYGRYGRYGTISKLGTYSLPYLDQIESRYGKGMERRLVLNESGRPT
jgi:hypothetical protein